MDAIVGSHHQYDSETPTRDGEEKRWSQLPSLLIWMIKDKLNIIDNFRLSCVCKHWESSSQNYTPPQEHSKQSVLWLLKKYHHYPPRPCEFVNLSTKETLILDLPEINRQTSTILYSKRGWLLIYQSFGNFQPRMGENSLVFLNPHTNAKITLPAIQKEAILKASFSVSEDDGRPQHVVFYGSRACCKPGTVTFCITAIDSEEWSKHSYYDSDKFCVFISLVVDRHKVYCLKSTQLLIFDMGSLCWRKLKLDPSPNSYAMPRIMESEGDIVKIVVGDDGKPYGAFSKLNDTETGWVELDDNEVRVWFLRGNCQYSCHDYSVKVNGGVHRVYKTDTKLPNAISTRRITYVIIHDLACNSEVLYEPDQDAKWEGDWVDLGWMHKPPPSCVSYVPSG